MSVFKLIRPIQQKKMVNYEHRLGRQNMDRRQKEKSFLYDLRHPLTFMFDIERNKTDYLDELVVVRPIVLFFSFLSCIFFYQKKYDDLCYHDGTNTVDIRR